MRGAVAGVSSVALFMLVGCQAATGAPARTPLPPPPPPQPTFAMPAPPPAPPEIEEEEVAHPQVDEALRTEPPPAGGPTPVIHVRMHAIVTANDDGSEPADATPEGIVKAVKATNAYFEPVGIQFDFDPRADLEYRRSTLLNYDCVLVAGRDRTGKPRCDSNPNAAERTAVATSYPRQMVVWFRSFNNNVKYDAASGFWKPSRATGGFSGANLPFVVVGPKTGGGTFLAHEIGHYLHLLHTFRGGAPNVPAAAEMIRRYVEEGGHPVEQGLAVFDGDSSNVSDTPPDAAGSIYISVGLDKCGPTNDIPIPVTFSNGARRVYTLSPNRHNIMSYFKDCHFSHDFSPQQIARMREALLFGNRRSVAQFTQ